MKMKMRSMTIGELQKIYTQPSVRAERNGFYLRKVGNSGWRKTNPDLQIHLPCLGIPIENDEPIDLMRGFVNMPKIAEVMNLAPDYATGFLFCKNFFVADENGGRRRVCHIALCDPEEAQYILIITAFGESSSGSADGMFEYAGVWNSLSSRYSSPLSYTERYGYSLVPIGFCDMPEGETQTSEDMEKTKREVVCLANQYLGIETEEAVEVEFGNNKDVREEAPGTILTNESLYLWAYEDDLSVEDNWVIDKCGRMLAPTVQDYKDKYLGAKVAEYRTWEKIPEGTLVLSWSKPSIASAHVFIVNIEPELVTCAQLERAAWLEDQIKKKYEGRCSPYAGGESPDIQDGWGLWEHRR